MGSTHLAWTLDKITSGVLSYDTIHNKQGGEFLLIILKSLNMNHLVLC